jgi:uncharacterized membrane protein
MIPYVAPIGIFVLLVVLHRLKRCAGRYSLSDAAAWSLAVMLLFTGGAHFSSLRAEMIAMVPPIFPRPDLLVTLTGVLELLGALGLLLRGTRVVTGVCLAILFVALLPANIYAARQGLTLGGKPVTPLALRIPEQFLYIALAVAPGWSSLWSHLRTPPASFRDRHPAH